MVEIGGPAPREFVAHPFGGEPQRHLERAGGAELGALGLQQVVDRRGHQGARGGKLFVREADREAARIVFPNLGIGIAHRGPVTEAGDIHGEDVGAGVTVDHPVGQRQADTAALAEARHHPAGAPEAGQPGHRAHQRVAIGGKGEGAVDDLLDPGAFEGREMAEPDFQRGGDTVDIGLQQFMPERPWRLLFRPGHAGAFVGAHQHAAAFLAQVKLAVEIDGMDDLFPGSGIVFSHFRHILGQKIHMLHGQNRQLQPHHAADLARP